MKHFSWSTRDTRAISKCKGAVCCLLLMQIKNVREDLLPLLECINKHQLDASVDFTEFLKEKIHLSLE